MKNITGTVHITDNKLELISLKEGNGEITDELKKLLALKEIVDTTMLNFEKEYQKNFLKLPKIANQYDLEVMINEIEKSKNGN